MKKMSARYGNILFEAILFIATFAWKVVAGVTDSQIWLLKGNKNCRETEAYLPDKREAEKDIDLLPGRPMPNPAFRRD